MLSALSSGARGKRFSCQISGCRNPSAVAGLLAGAPVYPTVYQPGVRAVNFHEMRGGSFGNRTNLGFEREVLGRLERPGHAAVRQSARTSLRELR